MSHYYHWHEDCARDASCLGDDSTRIIAPDDTEQDEGGWEHVCEGCGEPSEAAQALDEKERAYWEAYFTPAMREHMREQHRQANMSDADLEAESQTCGRRLVRPSSK